MQGHRFGTPASPAGRASLRFPSLLSARKSDNHPPVRSSFPRWLRVSSQLMSGIFAWNVLLAVPLQAHAQDVQTQKSAPVKPYAGIKSTIKPSHLPNRLSLPADCLVPLPVTASSAKQARPASLSLLNDTGHMARPVSASQVSTWRSELAANTLSRRGIALRQLWIGEWQMAHDENLIGAQAHFDTAAHLTAVKDKVHGLAVYDTAVNLMLGGRYEKARSSFEALLTSRKHLSGFDVTTCSLWARHARACAGYHAERAKLGIVEPERLDPNCGAAALAMWLRANNLPYDQATVVKAVRPTGRGSKTREVEAGAERLGLVTKTVAADEAALPYLPKPLMAFIEHDHFLAVTGTDKEGVTYNCSDCGKWPGGYQHITWSQWHKLEATEYTLFAKPYTAQASLIESIPVADKFLNTQGSNVTETPHTRTWRRHHVCAITPSGQCGYPNTTQQCDSQRCCPTDSPGATQTPNGASAGDPVNLATLQEEYKPAPDLTVYNPTGPSVTFARQYNSLNSGMSAEMGKHWSHNYDYYIMNFPGQNPAVSLYEPNGAVIPITVPNFATASQPSVLCSIPKGYPMQVYSKWNAQKSAAYFDIIFANRTRFSTSTGYNLSGSPYSTYTLAQITDAVGSYIQIINSVPTFTGNWTLQRINDSSGNALLTLNYDVNGHLSSIADRYSRSVSYQYGNFPYSAGGNGSGNWTEMTHVSQIVPTGTTTPPDRYAYGYGPAYNFSNEYWPALNAISVPSPTGTGTSTARIEYAVGTTWVSALVDANGNRREYTNVFGSSATQVTVKQKNADGTFTTNYTYTAGYDTNMSSTTATNGAGNTPSTRAYADANDPYKPSSITDASGHVTQFTWDIYGNLQTLTTPRNTVITQNWDYATFALGRLMSSQFGTKISNTYTYYEPSGLSNTISQPSPGHTGDGVHVSSTFTYNSLGSTLSAVTPGNNATATILTTTNYTTDGGYTQAAAKGQPLTITNNLGKVSHRRYDALGNVNSVKDALGNETNYTYNIANQIQTVVMPATGQTGAGRAYLQYVYLYPGGPTTAVNHYDESNTLAKQVVYAYGGEGEIKSRTGSTQPVAYTYDALYRMTGITDGNNHMTAYQFNTAGRISRIALPNASGTYDTTQISGYSTQGLETQRTDGKGVVTNYTYNDPENRLTNIQYPASPSRNVTLQYDAYGRRSSIADSTGTAVTNYDDQDRLTTVDTTYTGLATKSVLYGYYPNGSRQSLNTPGGATTYSYDGNGRPVSLSGPSGTASWTYLDNDWLWTQTVPSTLTATYTYNAASLLTRVTNANGTGTTISDFNNLQYDAVGNCTGMTSSFPQATTFSGNRSYTYDTRNEMTQEQATSNGGWTNTFAYDGAGNPTTMRGTTGINFNADNQRTGTGFVYDGNV